MSKFSFAFYLNPLCVEPDISTCSRDGDVQGLITLLTFPGSQALAMRPWESHTVPPMAPWPVIPVALLPVLLWLRHLARAEP